jgi:L-rhamnose mutarotase
MNTFAFKMKLKPGCKEEYKKRHEAIWPVLTDLLQSTGINSYQIYYDEETDILFGIQTNTGVDSQSLGSNPIVQKWWAFMADIMETNEDNSPISKPLENVFELK